MTSPEIVQALKAAPLFKSFTDTGIQIIASVAQLKEIPAGSPLFVENMIGEGLYVVASGRIRLAMRGPRGEEQILTTVGPPESLGESALLRAGPRLVSATAEIPSQVIEITRRDIAILQRSKPQACVKLMMGVVDLVGERLKSAAPEVRELLAYKLS